MSQNSKSQNTSNDSNSAGSSPRGPKQIESDLESNRSRMDDMLDQLQAKFSPDELIDQAKRYARRRTSDGSSSNLQEMVVRNPLPVALIGVGMAWLLLAGRNGSVPHEDSTRNSGRNSDYNSDHNPARTTSRDGRPDSQPALGDSGTSNSYSDRNNDSNSSSRTAGDRSSNNNGRTPDDQSEDKRVVVTETDLSSGKQSSETVIRASDRSDAGSTDHQSTRPTTGGDDRLRQVGAGHGDPASGPEPGRGPDRGPIASDTGGTSEDRGSDAAATRTSKPAPR